MPHSANLSDEQLVAAVREKDKELYSEIIERYQTKLYHYLRKFLKNNDELEDVLQEIFVKAYYNLNGFNCSKKFSPWIYRIAHNEAINHIKKYSKESVSLDESEWEIIDEKLDIAATTDSALARATIERGLASLKDKFREPLILFFFEQNSYEEISDILRIPRNTIGTFIMRGKTMLKEFLQRELYAKSKQQHRRARHGRD